MKLSGLWILITFTLMGCNKVTFSQNGSGSDFVGFLDPGFTVPDPASNQPPPELPVANPPSPLPPPPLQNIEASKIFYNPIMSGDGYPWSIASGGCVFSGFPEETYRIYPICELKTNLQNASNNFKALYFDVQSTDLSTLNLEIFSAWVNSANTQFSGVSFQIVGGLPDSTVSANLASSKMGKRLIGALKLIAEKSTHKNIVTVAVAVRGVKQFDCAVDLSVGISDVDACLLKNRNYPSEYIQTSYFIDQISVSW